MKTLEKEINELIVEINEITDMFYQQRVNEGLGILNALLNHIVEIVEMAEQCGENVDGACLVSVFGETLKAMESQDYILMSDILRDEMAGVLKNIRLC